MAQRDDVLSLHERRRQKDQDRPVNFSQIRRPLSPVRTDVEEEHRPVRAAQLTPPETPMSPTGGLGMVESQQSLFHNYLRAFCQYDQPLKPDVSDGELVVTAAIRPGDLILVHSVHENGWADGTVLTTGARGWLPTNYCESFDHPYMRNLLNAMTQFWDLLGAGEDANLSTFVRQDYIRGLIAGVRHLLERADCLHRDATLIQRHAGIRRMRKGLLADLSTLVQIAKRLQSTISEPFAGEVVHVLLDDLVAKAFRVVTRAVGFVDKLAQETADTRQSRTNKSSFLDRLATTAVQDGLTPQTRAFYNNGVTRAIDSAIDFPPYSTTDSNTRTASDNRNACGVATMGGPRSPAVFKPPSGPVAHRLSVLNARGARNGTLASERLAHAHDGCISHIGAFIGLHLHSHPSSEMVATTDHLVEACQALLAIVNEVSLHESQQTASVQHARTDFHIKLDELTKSTKDVFQYLEWPDDDVVMLPEQTNHLVSVGTSLIRSVGECVVKTRKLIEQVGDFQLNHANSASGTEGRNEADAGAGCPEERDQPVSRYIPAFDTLPPLSSDGEPAMAATSVTDFAVATPDAMHGNSSPSSPVSTYLHDSLRSNGRIALQASESNISQEVALKSPASAKSTSTNQTRKFSADTSIAGSADTQHSSMRDSGATAVSEASTRATTPDIHKDLSSRDPSVLNSFGSLASLRSAAATDDSCDLESQLLQKTYANELMLNKDGQVIGGSLPALVEQLTTHDSAPEQQFLAAFFITFRSFAASRELAQALVDRFDHVGDSNNVGTSVRLRVYNLFKGWLETYWNSEADKDALGDIRYFALHKLKPSLPQAGERLAELSRKVTLAYSTGATFGPLISGVGKVSMSIGVQYEREGSIPEPIITRGQLQALRKPVPTCNIMDFDPLELARQLTILTSRAFCDIQTEELLSLEWTKKNTPKARNVRTMCILNTDLAHVVGDTILGPDDAKNRAAVVKLWSKIAARCLDLNNYDSLMAIMCSLNSSVVQRLKRTWELVSKKTKARLDELNTVIDYSRNHASLRRRLEKPVAPCLPFLGIYLTDLTFVEVGNSKTRELPGSVSESGEPIAVINFDRHMRMAKIVTDLQRFQVPYKLQELPEMQTWIQEHLKRMREGHAAMVGQLHRRSLIIEPKAIKSIKALEERRCAESITAGERPTTARSTKTVGTRRPDGSKFEFFSKTNFALRSKTDAPVYDCDDHK